MVVYLKFRFEEIEPGRD